MTYEDVLVRSVLVTACLLSAAVAGWLFTPSFPVVFWLGLAASIGLSTAIIRSSQPRPVPIVAFAFCLGVMMGGIAQVFDANWNGVVLQAVLATLAVFAATLMLFATGKVRTSARMTQVFLVGLNGMILYAVAGILWRWLGLPSSPLGLDTDIRVVGVPLGAIVGVVGVLLGAYGFVMDFDFIKANVESGVPERYSWAAAFCLLVGLVFVYVQVAIILASLRSD
jgi:uncharacterized YccA/Bax inhibitor family protein